jgi:hypothetical protein
VPAAVNNSIQSSKQHKQQLLQMVAGMLHIIMVAGMPHIIMLAPTPKGYHKRCVCCVALASD